jgi:hypothetical protein
VFQCSLCITNDENASEKNGEEQKYYQFELFFAVSLPRKILLYDKTV